jgi:GTP cyclohydrolase II
MTIQHFWGSKQDHFIQQVERTIFDLRRGLPVVVRRADGMHLIAPVEGITAALFDEMRRGARGPTRLILTRHRLAHLGLDQPPEAAGFALQSGDTRMDVIRWAADPAVEQPTGRAVSPATEVERAALTLIRRGLLIPAAICVTPDNSFTRTIEARLSSAELLSVATADVFVHCRGEPLLQWTSEAKVPLEAAVNARFVVFREAGVMREHVAILIGDEAHWAARVPVRLHSACLTGDLFGSLRCDCGPQLRVSVAEIGKRGGGILLYLAQEGRGIGLVNKMRAYQIQDDGLDTVDADRGLGFGKDERNYAMAREMLAQLGITHIDLLTNNPAKVEAMNREPIRVAGHSGIYGRLTKENRRYLTTKARRAGHWLDALLSEPFASD